MVLFYRALIFVSSIFVGILILRYTDKIVNNVGYFDWAERYLGFGGGGGTYNLWKIIGILVIIAGIVIAVKGW